MDRQDAKPPQGPNHALLVGEVMGALMAAGIDAKPIIDDKRNYLDTLAVSRPSGTWLVRVAPEEVIEL